MAYPYAFDFKNPDYSAVFAWRLQLLEKLRADPAMLAAFKVHYRDNPADFIGDWGCTYDPRNLERGLPSVVPFVLFPKQVEFVEWIVRLWKTGNPGVSAKSRDVGASWLSVATSVSLCLSHDGMAIGFGSRKEEYVDASDKPRALFWKARKFLELLPPEFRGGWSPKHAPHMRISFPSTGSVISGEAGDNIGRGDRTSIYFVDEAHHIDRPMLVEASLSATTNCRIDLSSLNGSSGPFIDKLDGYPPEQVFTFHWRDDPRKDDEWYAAQVRKLDAVTLAQEVDMDRNASKSGILIPSAWVQSAIGAAQRLGAEVLGSARGALDVADEGLDANAFAAGRGVELSFLEEWSGVGSDTLRTTERAFNHADACGALEFVYDADGLGSGIRGDARMINERRKESGRGQLNVEAFRGSGAVINPESFIDEDKTKSKNDPSGRRNKDFFRNFKAQAWWALRLRFQHTHRAVVDGEPFDESLIISLDPRLPLLTKLCTELSQPTYDHDTSGRMIVDKTPPGTRSPNLADAVNMFYSPRTVKPVGFMTRKRTPHALAR